MNQFIESLKNETNRDALTTNGAVTNRSSLNAVVDLFFVAAGARNQNLSGMLALAFSQDRELSLRLVQWVRDVRGGAGEREQFRNFLRWLIANHSEDASRILNKTPELGRWDDVLVAMNTVLEPQAVEMVRHALLTERNGLCAKWLPRKGEMAAHLRKSLGWTPKFYRKTLVSLTNVVETPMCAKEWNSIELKKVPSLAFARYKRAFSKNAPDMFTGFVQAVQKGEAKMKADAVFPHDIVRSMCNSSSNIEVQAADEQWKALPNYLEENPEENILVMADTSDSMDQPISGSVRALDVCISLALYMSERLRGPFQNTFLTFSARPELQKVSGSLSDRVNQLVQAAWQMNTNLQAAFDLVLRTAVKNNVPQADMPTKIMIISDMEFDSACGWNTNFDNIKQKYNQAGYNMPQIVFWNVNGRSDNVPATIRDANTALISGFSPSIVKSVLGCTEISPTSVMMNTLMNPRYDLS